MTQTNNNPKWPICHFCRICNPLNDYFVPKHARVKNIIKIVKAVYTYTDSYTHTNTRFARTHNFKFIFAWKCMKMTGSFMQKLTTEITLFIFHKRLKIFQKISWKLILWKKFLPKIGRKTTPIIRHQSFITPDLIPLSKTKKHIH